MCPGIVVRRRRWRQLKIIKSRRLLHLPRLPAAVAIRAAVILPILLANIATAPVASDPEPFDVVRRFVVPPFVAIRAAVALAFQQSIGVPVRSRCHVWQARTSLDASRALVMLGLSSQTTMMTAYIIIATIISRLQSHKRRHAHSGGISRHSTNRTV